MPESPRGGFAHMNIKGILIIILIAATGFPVIYWQAGQYEKTAKLLRWSTKLTIECVNDNMQSCKLATMTNKTLDHYVSELLFPLPAIFRARESYKNLLELRKMASTKFAEAEQSFETIPRHDTATGETGNAGKPDEQEQEPDKTY